MSRQRPKTAWWFKHEGEILSLRALCRKLKCNYSTAIYHVKANPKLNDYSWVFTQPKGTVFMADPSDDEAEAANQKTWDSAHTRRPFYPEDVVPPAVTRFLTAPRP